MLPKLSICIPTKNRKQILTKTLDTIFHHQDLHLSDFEVIVTNDGTEQLDDLLNLFPYKNLKIVPNKHKPGSAGGRNNGTELAKSPIIIFLDDDIIVTPQFLKRVISVHDEFDNIIVTGNRIYPDNLIEIAKKYPFGRYKLKHEYEWLNKASLIHFKENLYIADNLASFSASMRKATYEKVGQFNEQFKYAGCEDAEFFYRAQKSGITLLFDESNICYHNELDNFTLKAWLNRQSTGILSAVVVCQLHPEGKEHPTWFTNTPISKNDLFWVKRLKIKKWLLSRTLIMKLLFAMVYFFEKINLSDKILFRLYNALWLGSTYKSFKKAYRELYLSK